MSYTWNANCYKQAYCLGLIVWLSTYTQCCLFSQQQLLAVTTLTTYVIDLFTLKKHFNFDMRSVLHIIVNCIKSLWT